jgi:hypothetical protein
MYSLVLSLPDDKETDNIGSITKQGTTIQKTQPTTTRKLLMTHHSSH